MIQVGPSTRAQTRRLALMAVVAVLLGTVVAANLSEAPGSDATDPRASFTFDTDNETVLVTHYGGDEIDPAHLYVESDTRGRLGTFDGSDGMACERNVTRVVPGSACRVTNATHEKLYVVWDRGENRSLILDRRAADPTPTPSPTPTPNATVSQTPGPTTPNGTATPTATGAPATPGTPTPSTPATSTGTPTGTASTPGTGTPTPAPTTTNGTEPPAGSPTPSATPTGTESDDD